jgi:hypothetical protein
MKFDIPRRPTEFGGFNNRWENMGSGGEKRKAIDLPFRVQVKIGKELNMLVPTGVPGSVSFSTFVYGKNPRKPNRTTHVLSPLKVHRKPEHIKVMIYDHELDKRKWLTFDDVTVKDPLLELEEDKVYLSGKLQIHPTIEQFARLAENVETKTREFECYATAPELLDQEDEEDEEDDDQADIEDDDEEGDDKDDAEDADDNDD